VCYAYDGFQLKPPIKCPVEQISGCLTSSIFCKICLFYTNIWLTTFMSKSTICRLYCLEGKFEDINNDPKKEQNGLQLTWRKTRLSNTNLIKTRIREPVHVYLVVPVALHILKRMRMYLRQKDHNHGHLWHRHLHTKLELNGLPVLDMYFLPYFDCLEHWSKHE